MNDQDLFTITRRTQSLVASLRHIARGTQVDEAAMLNELTELELQVAGLTHEAQMREVQKWRELPLRGRVTRPVVLSTELEPRLSVDRTDIDGLPKTNARMPAPALSGRWCIDRTKVRRAS